jgi:hypothetical protein
MPYDAQRTSRSGQLSTGSFVGDVHGRAQLYECMITAHSGLRRRSAELPCARLRRGLKR